MFISIAISVFRDIDFIYIYVAIIECLNVNCFDNCLCLSKYLMASYYIYFNVFVMGYVYLHCTVLYVCWTNKL